MAYCRASLINLYLHTKFHSNRKNFFVEGQMDVCTDSGPALLGWLGGVYLKTDTMLPYRTRYNTAIQNCYKCYGCVRQQLARQVVDVSRWHLYWCWLSQTDSQQMWQCCWDWTVSVSDSVSECHTRQVTVNRQSQLSHKQHCHVTLTSPHTV